MDLAAHAISNRLMEMIQNRDLLGLDIETLRDARESISLLVERIAVLENTIGPPLHDSDDA